jgi:hypothetical protein
VDCDEPCCGDSHAHQTNLLMDCRAEPGTAAEVLGNDSPHRDLEEEEEVHDVVAADADAEEDIPTNQTREDMVAVVVVAVAAAVVARVELSWLAVAPGADDERHFDPASVVAAVATRPFSGCTHRPR